MSISEIRQAVDSFVGLVKSQQHHAATAQLDNLKGLVLSLDSLPPLGLPSPTAEEERKIAINFLEHAVILSVENSDKSEFQRYFSCLKPFYSDRSDVAQTSPLMHSLIGLYLLFLLVENRLSDFHCELELLADADREQPAITFCTKLDQHLMVGSYDKVLAAATHPPVPFFKFFLTSLLETVRINIGMCAEAAYINLSIASATDILMFTSQEETVQFLGEYFPSWNIVGNNIDLKVKVPLSARAEAIPSLNLIAQNLSYATELERIV